MKIQKAGTVFALLVNRNVKVDIMKRILVPVDFSGDSLKALRFAIYMANKLGSHLRMVHVQKSENFEIPFHFEELKNEIIHTVQEYFEKLVELHSSDYTVENGVFDFKIRTGSVYREIVNQAKYGDAYMIMMGAYGASGFEEFFIGSNAFKVVSHASCPVITVQNQFLKGQLKTIVMPVDSSIETRKKIPFVVEIAAKCNADVHILGVHETSDFNVIGKIKHYMRQAEGYLKEENVSCVKSLRQGDNNTFSTLDYAREVDADLIAIMTEQAETSFNMFFGSYAQQMVNRSEIPILSVPNMIHGLV